MNKVLNFYDRIARYYDWINNLFRLKSSMGRFVKSLDLDLSAHPRILDLGCGTGQSINPWKEKYPKAEIWGIDGSYKMLIIAAKNNKSITLVHGDYHQPQKLVNFYNARSVTIPEHHFDVIFSAGSLREYGDWKILLTNIKQWLKPNGILFCLGLKKSWYNHLQQWRWKFNLEGVKAFMGALEKSEFKEVKPVPIPRKFFPSSFIYDAVIAKNE